MKKCHIYDLEMIITNNCNLDCAHCLRGQKNCTTMSDEVIEATLSQVRSVDTLNLSGGEPTLALDRIEKIIDYIIKNRIKVGDVTLTINGTIYSEELLKLLDEISKYIGDDEVHGLVAISLDKYHLAEIIKLGLYDEFIENLRRYRESKYFAFTREENPKLKLFREGNAEALARKLTVPLREIKPVITYVRGGKLDIKNGLCNIGPFVTISATGNVTTTNASNEHQDTIYNYGSVLNESIEDICIRNGSPILKPKKYIRTINRTLNKYLTYNK